MNEMINEILDFEKNKNNKDFNNYNQNINHNSKMNQFKEIFEPYIKDGKIDVTNSEKLSYDKLNHKFNYEY